MSDTLADILNRRKAISGNTNQNNTFWWLEKHGASICEATQFEPDPNTYRHDYYFNTKDNALFRKLNLNGEKSVWKRLY